MTRAALLASLAALGVAGAASTTSYYPYTAGKRWAYSNGEVQVVGAARTVRGLPVTPVAHQVGGKTVTEDLLEVRADGVYLRGILAGGNVNAWYNPPLLVYPSGPLTPGTRWESASGRVRLAGRVMGQQALSTAGGRYNTLVIRTDLTTGAGTTTQYQYFVPGLGTVRYATADGSSIDLTR
ncbi:hypothetical protein [Deinococcus maricopensis]|uniref:Uncharacterized protein n=1 Tax=Deinococcus maricopensis (strain DSM 21211 / LMG 22137 / NRRL B-23946 / LB-34) TaxID=709986 RepID=E8UB34_DEIML|nr:hypothetical protein [Deinococcus maricopensis]ADV68273.1 hypothetical protein Deima_2640 [Deinococcus maricopensis DSM 21211]